MKRSQIIALTAAALVLCLCRTGSAQYVTYYSPVVTPVVQPAPTVVYRPVTPTVVARPVVPTTVYYAPAPTPVYTVARPVVTTSAWAPVAYTRTRWRPLLGGTVTRVRYGYAPVTVAVPAY